MVYTEAARRQFKLLVSCYKSSKWQDDNRYDSKHNKENYAVFSTMSTIRGSDAS